jgi:hypothetical protein
MEKFYDLTDHRNDWETCPHCNFKMQPHKWLDNTVKTHASERAMSIIVESECPDCFKTSWIHRGKKFMNKYLGRKHVR